VETNPANLQQSPRTYCFGVVSAGFFFVVVLLDDLLLSFLAEDEDFVFVFVLLLLLSAELDPLEGACATARLAPSISVTTNISSFFMPSPSKI
jgi:hypothetical protein